MKVVHVDGFCSLFLVAPEWSEEFKENYELMMECQFCEFSKKMGIITKEKPFRLYCTNADSDSAETTETEMDTAAVETNDKMWAEFITSLSALSDKMWAEFTTSLSALSDVVKRSDSSPQEEFVNKKHLRAYAEMINEIQKNRIEKIQV